jgi:hypothetical protein
MMTIKLQHLCLLGAFAGAPLAQAQDIFTKVDDAPKNELWLDSGFATLHYDRDKDLNGNNRGIGGEYRFSGSMSAMAGRFYNSNREHSLYAGVLWQPYAVGPVRLGAVVAGFNGYPNMRHGGWFPALIPVATFDYQRVGVNIGVVPSYKDRLYGGISLQLKLKLFE